MNFLNNIKKNQDYHIDYDFTIQEETLWTDACFLVELQDIDNDSILQYCDELQKISQGRQVSNVGGWQHELNSEIENSAINLLLKQSEEVVNQIFTKKYKLSLPKRLCLETSWLNENYKHNYNINHVHPGCVYVGVYYVCGADNEENGPLYFTRDSMYQLNSTYGQACNDIDNGLQNSIYNQCQVGLNPSPGFAVFFPPWYQHQVLPNLNGGRRVSIAMNFK